MASGKNMMMGETIYCYWIQAISCCLKPPDIEFSLTYGNSNDLKSNRKNDSQPIPKYTYVYAIQWFL